MTRRVAALVDVDGTLVDSNYQHVLAWQRAFADCGRPVAAATLHRLVGMGGDRYVAAATDEQWDAEHGDRARDAHTRYFMGGIEHMHALPGARELVEQMVERDIAVVLASSSDADECERHLQTVGIDPDTLAGVVNSSHVESTKPASEIFERALQASGGEAASALVVADTVWDIKAATKIDIATAAVTTGGIARPVLERAGARWVFDSAGELGDALDEIVDVLLPACV